MMIILALIVLLIAAAIWLRKLIQSNQRLIEKAKEFKLLNKKNNQQKNIFLATASHDLQQPHQALGLFLASLNAETLDLENTRIINKAKDAFETTSRLLHQLLDISRLDTTEQPMLTPLALHDWVHAIGMKFLPVAACYGVELRIRQRDAYAMTDAVMLERMITNILLNAFRHAKHSNILLSIRKKVIDGQKKWRIEIYDTGMGIAKDKQEIIFHEFTKLNKPERSPTGLGLGLAIVQRLSKILNHPVGLRSKLGRGSCFYIELDAIKKNSTHVLAPKLSDSVIRARLKVAVINENDMVSDSLHTLLSSWGCKVKTYPSSYKALTDITASAWMPDALIVDGTLRNTPIDLSEVEEIHTFVQHDMPMILITEKPSSTYANEAKEFGFALLASPIDSKVLRDLLGER